MKHGVHWKPLGRIGADRLPPGAHCHGFPVKFDPDQEEIALSGGLWRKRYIVVGKLWFRLTGEEQWAVLLHEAGHCVHNHFFKRILMIPAFWTRWVYRMASRQELEADLFVAKHGYGDALLSVLTRVPNAGVYYPDHNDRILHLQAAILEERHEAAAA